MSKMGLFNNLFKKEAGISIGAPLAGKCVSIKEVPDPTFADEILGKGVAFIPADGKVYAPADGVITTLFPTGHAVAITTDDGVEILIHVGLETVSLEGKAFTIHTQMDAKVKKGDLLLEADLKAIEEAGLKIITPMVICNTDEFSQIEGMTDKEVIAGDEVLKLQK